MLPLLLAFGSGMGWGTADFLGGLSTRRLPLLTVSLISQTVGLLLLVAVVAIHGAAPAGSEPLLVGIGGGLVGAAGLAALYRALAIGRMSIVAPTAALSGTVPVAWGLLRGDRPEPIQYVGVVLAIAGIVLAARTPDRSGARDTTGIGLALVAAITLGAFVVFLDEGARGDPLWTALMVRVSAISALGIAALFVRPSFRVSGSETGRLGAIGLLDTGGNLAFAFAADTGGMLALTSVLGSLYPVATVLLARWVLHERLSAGQVAGVAAALAGVALIAAG
jgi:drug/metabolite transporter (DMT)-like permease